MDNRLYNVKSLKCCEPDEKPSKCHGLYEIVNNIVKENVKDKQNKLIAGDNITIKDDVISATGGGGSVEQQQTDWDQTDENAVDYIKNKPTLSLVAISGLYNDLRNKPIIPTVPTDVSAFNNDAQYLTENDIDNKQDEIPIVQISSGITSINAAVNTYYKVEDAVNDMAITLPTPTDTSNVAIVVIHLLAGTTPNVVIGSTAMIDYSAAYDISAGNEYEINCLFNGDKWVVADMEVL